MDLLTVVMTKIIKKHVVFLGSYYKIPYVIHLIVLQEIFIKRVLLPKRRVTVFKVVT